jgi:hypothetical protein
MSKHGEGDKRKVSTDALETLGTIIGPNEKRDAIHLAVEPVIAGEWLDPGEHVRIDPESGYAYGCEVGKGVGIVDPFLADTVKPAQRFWLVIYPRQIHSLRHVWTHPAFPDEPEPLGMMAAKPPSVQASESWLRDFCETRDMPSYERVMAAITDEPVYVNPDATRVEYQDVYKDSEYWTFQGVDAHCDIPDEFWEHVENVLGRRISQRTKYFSCSC